MNDETNQVLIVDDEIDICYLLSVIIKQRNLVPTYVHTLADAISNLNTKTPSILFLDNHLPDGLGVEFIRHVKINHPGVTIILITAYDSVADKKLALSEGADFFIGKPFTKVIVNEVLNKIVK